MTNDECLMTKEVRMANGKWQKQRNLDRKIGRQKKWTKAQTDERSKGKPPSSKHYGGSRKMGAKI